MPLTQQESQVNLSANEYTMNKQPGNTIIWLRSFIRVMSGHVTTSGHVRGGTVAGILHTKKSLP